MSIKIHVVTKENYDTFALDIDDMTRFLQNHLDEYGDDPEAIEQSITYALSESEREKGFLIVAMEDDKPLGITVMNATGMDDYVPPNFLVYIAVDKTYRGRGIGKSLMNTAIEETEGSISLHVEYDNPAKKLYEAMGFTSKYAEMRLTQEA